MAGGKLRLQEGKQFHVLAVALGIGGVAFGDRNVLGSFLERGSRNRYFIKQRAMHDEVGVAADGGGEVRVFFLGQAVMTERFDRVARAHE